VEEMGLGGYSKQVSGSTPAPSGHTQREDGANIEVAEENSTNSLQ